MLAVLLALLLGAHIATAAPPADRLRRLQRGINITNWFRYPPSRDLVVLRAYLGDPAMRDLRRAGFTFVRLPVQPDVLAAPGVAAALADAMARLERNGLAVMVVPHLATWRVETKADDRAALLAMWHTLAPMLHKFDPGMIYPELLNEPVFADAPDAWARLQH